MKIALLSLLLIFLGCESENSDIKSIEIIEYEYFLNEDKTDWKFIPLSYYLVESDGKAFGYIDQRLALEDNSFSTFQIAEKLIEDFMLLADTVDSRNRPISSQFSISSLASRVKINYKNDNYKSFFLPKHFRDNELIKRIEIHKRKHQFVDSIAFTKKKSISKVDTVAVRRRIKNLSEFSEIEDKYDDRLMPLPSDEYQIQFIKK